MGSMRRSFRGCLRGVAIKSYSLYLGGFLFHLCVLFWREISGGRRRSQVVVCKFGLFVISHGVLIVRRSFGGQCRFATSKSNKGTFSLEQGKWKV